MDYYTTLAPVPARLPKLHRCGKTKTHSLSDREIPHALEYHGLNMTFAFTDILDNTSHIKRLLKAITSRHM